MTDNQQRRRSDRFHNEYERAARAGVSTVSDAADAWKLSPSAVLLIGFCVAFVVWMLFKDEQQREDQKEYQARMLAQVSIANGELQGIKDDLKADRQNIEKWQRQTLGIVYELTRRVSRVETAHNMMGIELYRDGGKTYIQNPQKQQKIMSDIYGEIGGIGGD